MGQNQHRGTQPPPPYGKKPVSTQPPRGQRANNGPSAAYSSRYAAKQQPSGGSVNSQGSSSNTDPFKNVKGASAEDFDRLCKSITDTVSKISDVVGRGITEAGDALSHAVEKGVEKGREYQGQANSKAMRQAHKNAAKSANLANRRYFKGTGGLTAAGTVMTTVGGICTFSFGLGAVTALVGPGIFLTSAEWSATLGVSGIFTALSVWLLAAGIKRLSLARHARAFQRIFGGREACSFEELANQLHVSPKKVLKWSRKMLRAGLFPQGHIDDEETCLMITNETYQLYRQAQQAYRQHMAEQRRQKSEKQAMAEKRKRELGALPAQVQEFVTEGARYLRELHNLDVDIDDKAVSEHIVAIEHVLGRIIDRVKEEPSVLPYLDKLSSYYLPTTIKLLQAYNELEEEPVQGSNIKASRLEIENTLDTLHKAFEKLLDETYRDTALDVSADITVLNAMLAQEGLTETPFDFDPADAAGDIFAQRSGGASGSTAKKTPKHGNVQPSNSAAGKENQ